ncbi:SUMF1/EgtB/PvdO family nonheme iron enzyme [Fusobacterium simiae]|uniref:SUMF1/EgtB/PvdO family nonheme iron enzyme n=1 Tax=Fusobacterium simiae TaxID=855 RepID=UPI0020C55951|nr:SUMF1/EgtB/PvdO family nonheme iron enzyme [Fusobacterium simiae]MDC7956179.1 SUMF1/EgtB/PvdO family nonheme iron enzyme [Fusobacterium simiae]
MKSKFKDMIFVKGGKYKPYFTDDEKEVFDLEVCRYQTTQKMWLEVMENNPSKFKGIYKPVDTVTWWQALEFCNKLSEKYNLEPVYDLSKKRMLMINQLGEEKASPDLADFKKTKGFRLSTEVEWEWFVRGEQIAIDE